MAGQRKVRGADQIAAAAITAPLAQHTQVSEQGVAADIVADLAPLGVPGWVSNSRDQRGLARVRDNHGDFHGDPSRQVPCA